MRTVVGLICLLLALGVGPLLAFRSYSGYQVLRTSIVNEKSLQALAPLLDRPEFDFWSEPFLGRPADIMASPEHVSLLRTTLDGLGLQPTVLVPDVGVLVQEERKEIKKRRIQAAKRNELGSQFDNFMKLSEITQYLKDTEAAFPNIATVISIGISHEGLPLNVLKLSNGPGKTGIWFDSAIHAREWAGPPTLLYAIKQLTENLEANQAMLDKNDFYFLPVANPDGYSYSWTYDRFWRKTRKITVVSSCIGTDPNRNFKANLDGNKKQDPCSNTYPGDKPFSEPEVRAIASFLRRTTSITFYCAVHSHGQFLLYPYGHTLDLPPNNDKLFNIGTEAVEALKEVHDTEYKVGGVAQLMYFATGSSLDWAYSQNISLAYTIELPGGGTRGFDLPASEILPVVTETWEAFKVFAANIPSKRGL